MYHSCKSCKISVWRIYPLCEFPFPAWAIPVAAMLQFLLLVDPLPLCGLVTVLGNLCSLLTKKSDMIVSGSGIRKAPLFLPSIEDITLVTSLTLVES